MKFYEQKDFVLLSESNPFSNKLKPVEKTNLQTWPNQSIKGLSKFVLKDAIIFKGRKRNINFLEPGLYFLLQLLLLIFLRITFDSWIYTFLLCMLIYVH